MTVKCVVKKPLWILSACAAFAVGGCRPIAVHRETSALSEYALTDIGTLGGGVSAAFGINDVSEISGGSATGGFFTQSEHAFLWRRGVMKDIGSLEGKRCRAADINNKGQIVGRADMPDGSKHAFIYDGGKMLTISAPGGLQSEAHAINEHGEVVGVTKGLLGETAAFLWKAGKFTNLERPLGDAGSNAEAINDHGQIAGSHLTASGDWRACLWRSGGFVSLGAPGGGQSKAHAINNHGDVVGYSFSKPNSPGVRRSRGFLWRQGAFMDLGTLGGNNCEAYSINDQGDIVGRSDTAQGFWRAFLYRKGVMYDLNRLIAPGSGWNLKSARAINNSGQIVGIGRVNSAKHGFLLRALLRKNQD